MSLDSLWLLTCMVVFFDHSDPARWVRAEEQLCVVFLTGFFVLFQSKWKYSSLALEMQQSCF